MIQYLCRLLWVRYKRWFLEYAVEDLYGQIPGEVAAPAIDFLGEKRTKVTQFFLWQAFILQRRLANNPTEGAMVLGMLIQIKINLQMIAGSKSIDEIAPNTISAAEATRKREEKEKEDLDTILAGIDKFKKGLKD